jgi:hypothetical protein
MEGCMGYVHQIAIIVAIIIGHQPDGTQSRAAMASRIARIDVTVSIDGSIVSPSIHHTVTSFCVHKVQFTSPL